MATSTQQAEFAEQRAQEERDRRAEVYLNFLQAADKYATETVQVRDCLTKAIQPQAVRIDAACTRNVLAMAPARYDFQGARNEVFVYGSVVAEKQAGLIAGYLPDAVGGDPSSGLPPVNQAVFRFEQERFNQLYQDFMVIVCEEVPAHPRASCEG